MSTRSPKAVVRSFRDLVIWQKALVLAEEVYQATRKFPKQEIYGLTSQMCCAAVSVASNIAEGHARQSRGEFLHFLGVARGSLAELQTQTVLAKRLEVLADQDEEILNARVGEVGRLLNTLRRLLGQRA